MLPRTGAEVGARVSSPVLTLRFPYAYYCGPTGVMSG